MFGCIPLGSSVRKSFFDTYHRRLAATIQDMEAAESRDIFETPRDFHSHRRAFFSRIGGPSQTLNHIIPDGSIKAAPLQYFSFLSSG